MEIEVKNRSESAREIGVSCIWTGFIEVIQGTSIAVVLGLMRDFVIFEEEDENES